jgi:hypothetical protein
MTATTIATATTEPVLPPLFLLAATHALCIDNKEAVAEELQAAAVRIAPTLTAPMFLDREQVDLYGPAYEAYDLDVTKANAKDANVRDASVLAAALTTREQRQALEEVVTTAKFYGIQNGLSVGLAAGYLLAKMLDGAR